MTRIFDILFSFFGLLLLSPILLVLITIGYFNTGSPIFRQERVGKGKKPFRLMKFRSMYVNAPSVATHLASASSITPFGSFLRKSKLDELPQLWNVFVGDMSLVGPRPQLPKEVELYLPDERQRLLAKPGITCTWQVSGRSEIDFRGQVRLDIEYIRSMNTLTDIKLLIMTVPAVVLGKGAY